jgi:hypothetical protein
VPGGTEGGGGLGGALLGLAQLGDGFGQGGEADQQHDWGERAIADQVGACGDQPGGMAELVPGRGRGGYPPVGLAGGTVVVIGSPAQGAAAERGGGHMQRIGGGAGRIGGSGRVPGRGEEPDPGGRVGGGAGGVVPQGVSFAWCQRGVGAGRAGPPMAELGPAQIGGELAASVPDRFPVPGRVIGERDGVPGDLAGVTGAVPQPDQALPVCLRDRARSKRKGTLRASCFATRTATFT